MIDLKKIRWFMQAVFENTIASIMILDINGKFEAINNTASKIIGMAQAEVVGLSLYEVFSKEEAKIENELYPPGYSESSGS